MITTETESIHALSIEAETTVNLARDFYSCIVRDLRSKSGAHHRAVRPSLPSEVEVQRILSGPPPPLDSGNGSSNDSRIKGQ